MKYPRSTESRSDSCSKEMTDLEYQEDLAKLTIPQLIERISRLTENYNKELTMLTHEILIRSMQQAE